MFSRSKEYGNQHWYCQIVLSECLLRYQIVELVYSVTLVLPKHQLAAAKTIMTFVDRWYYTCIIYCDMKIYPGNGQYFMDMSYIWTECQMNKHLQAIYWRKVRLIQTTFAQINVFLIAAKWRWTDMYWIIYRRHEFTYLNLCPHNGTCSTLEVFLAKGNRMKSHAIYTPQNHPQ